MDSRASIGLRSVRVKPREHGRVNPAQAASTMDVTST
jgi:hypothetical protein